MFFKNVFAQLIHILICDIVPPNGARQNSRPYYFLCTPPHWRRQRNSRPYYFLCTPPHRPATRRPATRHCPISQRRRASSAAEKALFSFLFFSSAPETTIFLLTRRSATLPMCAGGGTCVIDVPRRQCVLHLIFIQK